jgi:hypothetical protein
VAAAFSLVVAVGEALNVVTEPVVATVTAMTPREAVSTPHAV